MAKKKKKDDDVLSTNVIVQKLATHYWVRKPFTDDVPHEFLVYDSFDVKNGVNFIFGLTTVGDDKVLFNGDLYTTEKELLAAVEAYNSELMFPSNTYDPSCPGTTRTEMQLHWYLTTVLGYEADRNFMSEEIYVKKDAYGNNIGHIAVKTDDASIPNDVTSGTVSMTIGPRNIYTANFENGEEAVKAINALAFPGTAHNLSDAAKMLDTMEKYGFSYSKAIRIDYGQGGIENLSKVKDDVIERLEKMLKKLKES